jgi:hypothetical protein
MKINVNIKLAKLLSLMVISLIVLASCDPDKSLNVSPNAISDQSIKSVDGILGLTVAMQVGTSEFYTGDRSRILSIWSWQMCAPAGLGRPQPVQWNTYLMQEDGFPDDVWKTGYRTIKICNDIIDNMDPSLKFGTANTEIQSTLIGMAKANKALVLGELAAMYGSIPIKIVGLESSVFVSQTAAFAEVQKLLDEAVTSFNLGGASGLLSRDLNFKGDKTKWIEACHSLMARYFLMTKDYTKASAHAKLGIKAATSNLLAQYSDNAGEHNPWGHWSLDESGEPIRVDANYMRLLQKEAGDTRIAEYFKANGPNGEFLGFWHPRSDTLNFKPDTNEVVGIRAASLKKYSAYATKFPMITLDETGFILAEASAKTGDEATATAIVNAVRAAAGLPAFTGTGAALLAEVMKQKHLQLFLEGQTYYDMRRLGTLPQATVPNRFIYPITEKTANPNVPSDAGVDMSAVSK